MSRISQKAKAGILVASCVVIVAISLTNLRNHHFENDSKVTNASEKSNVKVGVLNLNNSKLVVSDEPTGDFYTSGNTTNVSGGYNGYATNVSISGLLSATNNFRAQNGLTPLSLNIKLNRSSQSKAQHMIDNNYWAHVAPDGTQPWYFFNQAGYTYSAAGENLAYGFDSSYGILDGWMMSPMHRANVLGDYSDVGFGIASGPSFQGGASTIIVAHYGNPVR